ncbi:hypothetical protein J6E39_00175 [bacterium]|nr:hypothetical protein [bacterium]
MPVFIISPEGMFIGLLIVGLIYCLYGTFIGMLIIGFIICIIGYFFLNFILDLLLKYLQTKNETPQERAERLKTEQMIEDWRKQFK